MVLRNLESRLESAVEGLFARVFRSGLQPVEITNRLIKELDGNRQVDVRGQAIAPNFFVVRLAAADAERFEPMQESLRRDLVAAVRQHAQAEQLRFLGRVAVEFETDTKLTVGRCRVMAEFEEAVGAGTTAAYLELPDGSHLELSGGVISVGRHSDCHLVLSDPNASRYHAELRPAGDTYMAVDLQSMNGTKRNGHRITSELLQDGDEITFGTVTVRFHQM